MAEKESNGRPINVPGWVWTAATILAVGVVAGRKLEKIEGRLDEMAARLCRIEAATRSGAWYTCRESLGPQQANQAGAP